MAFYLILIKLFVAAKLTESFIRDGNASLYAGLIAFVQTILLVFLGEGLSAILFSGVFFYTLWMGFFHLVARLENRPTLWTLLTILILLPFLSLI